MNNLTITARLMTRSGRPRLVTTFAFVVMVAGACPTLMAQRTEPAGRSAEEKEPARPANPAKKSGAVSDNEDRLRKRLVDQAVKGRPANVMDRIIDLMKESAERIDLSFDPGKETQQYQQEIIEQLDAAIEAAAARTKRTTSNAPSPGDKRKMKKPSQQESRSPEGKGKSVNSDGQERELQPGQVREGDGAEQSKDFDARLGWGALPPRDRDEVIQGFGEEYLEAYRRWIERYYRALQEAGE